MTKILLIVPTRGRPDKATEFYEQFVATTSSSTTLCFGLDDDDVEYPRFDGVMYEVNPRMWMNGTLNFIANKYANDYDYIAFLGDDHRPRTQDWDLKLVDAIKDIEYGIAYGNDLLQGENLPTAVLLDAKIVRKLGYMAPPVMKHLYLDNFWRDIGRKLGTLRYKNEIIIEHMHYSVGKSEADAQYEEVNNSEMYTHDQMVYMQYVQTGFRNDLAKLV